jgi:hypothetical protein
VEPKWQCDRKCGKSFKCGFHQCEQVCHEGECGKSNCLSKRFHKKIINKDTRFLSKEIKLKAFFHGLCYLKRQKG